MILPEEASAQLGDPDSRLAIESIFGELGCHEELVGFYRVLSEGPNHRGRLWPLHRLHRRFGIERAVTDSTAVIVVVIEAASGTYVLLLDELLYKQEVVNHSCGAFPPNLPGVAGGAILGGGTIALILDPAGISVAA